MKQNECLHPYSQARLLDALIDHLQLKRDSDLARTLGVSRTFICVLRQHKTPIGAAVLIRMHEASGMSIKELRRLLGDRRKRFRGGYSIYSAEDRAENRIVEN